MTGNRPSGGGKQRLMVQSARTRIKDHPGSQIRTSYFKIGRTVRKWIWEGSKCSVCVHLCGIEAEEKVEAPISACDLLENILAYGCFNSSRPVSLPQRSGPIK